MSEEKKIKFYSQDYDDNGQYKWPIKSCITFRIDSINIFDNFKKDQSKNIPWLVNCFDILG